MRLFITATGTDIGKTFLTCQMARALRHKGKKVRVLKPVTSGFDPADDKSDIALLLKAVGLPFTESNIRATSLYRFRAPLSPDMAARREDVSIDFGALKDFCERKTDADITLIEGVGGVMSPVAEDKTVLDLIRALKAPCLLLTGSYLGSISHALTACSTLLHAGITIRGMVISESEHAPIRAEEMAATLKHFVSLPILCLPRSEDETSDILSIMQSFTGLRV
jgi:dethiobiotin synthetase